MAPVDHTSQSSSRQRRSHSISSNGPSLTSNRYGGLLSPPSTVSPDPAFIATSAASMIVTNDHDSQAHAWFNQHGIEPSRETALVALPALKLVNRFLDQLLFNFLSVSRSTSLASLRPAVAEVLKPKLANGAISGADQELHKYLGGGEEELLTFHNGLEPSGYWNPELVWKRTRLRCMVYSSLGDMEEEDEDYYIEQQQLDGPPGLIYRFSNNPELVSPAVAIFLTSILEFMGEQVLVVAGQAAYHKLRAKHEKKEQDSTSTSADIAERVVVEDIDVEKVALDRTLGQLWRGLGNSFRGDFSDPTETATAMSRDSGYASMVSKQLLGGGSNESDTKSIASLESHITSASSLNPASVGGAAEELAEILLDNEEIRQCVERGFVAMDSDRFERNFIRLLKSYASELRAEADTHIQKSATHIVHSYRAYVTRIIRRQVVGLDDDSQATAFHSIKDQTTTKLTLERFLAQQQPTETSDQVDTRPEDEQESNGDSHSDDQEPYLPNLGKLTDFLVSSTAFRNFKARLEAFVKSNSELQQTLEDSSSRVRESDEHVPIKQPKDPGFLIWVKNVLRRSLRPPIPPGSQRIEWICDCGDLLHMDFNSNSTGSFPTMNALLRFQSATLQPSGSSHTPGRSLPGALSMPMQACLKGNISQNLATQSSPVPGLHTPRTSLEAAATASTTLTPLNLIFFELCVNAGKLLKSLGEIDISSINTDGDFFSTVKAHYLRLRSFRAQFWLLKPVTVSYVRFSVEDRCRVGILHKPVALPPKTEVDAKRYHYNPCPLENELPISSDLFLHYLFSCSSPSHNLIWLPRIPRKLDTSILASPTPASFGWGVHIDEGPDYLKIFMLNLVVLGISGVTALLWEVFRHDIQGAMGLAAWIVMLLNTLMAVFVAKWSQE